MEYYTEKKERKAKPGKSFAIFMPFAVKTKGIKVSIRVDLYESVS